MLHAGGTVKPLHGQFSPSLSLVWAAPHFAEKGTVIPETAIGAAVLWKFRQKSVRRKQPAIFLPQPPFGTDIPKERFPVFADLRN